MLFLIQSVDKSAAIFFYEDSRNDNSICHQNHVPMDQEKFEQYFPRSYAQQVKITVKCRMKSSLSLTEIKWKIRPKLESY